MPEKLKAAAAASARPLRLLVVAALVLPALVFAVGAAISYRGHFAEARDQLARNTDILHEHAVKVFETLDLAANQVDQILFDLTDEEIRTREAGLNPRLKALVDRLAQVQDVWVLDRDGRPLVTGNVYPVPAGLVLADRNYFRVHRDGEIAPDQAYVSELLKGRVQNVTFFQLSKRRQSGDERPSAAFDGVVAISVEPGYFADFFRQLVPSSLDAATLLRGDGAVLARFPPAPGDLTQLPRGGTFLTAIAQSPERGFFEAPSAIDAEDRIVAYRKLPERPVYVLAGIERATVLAAWRSTMASHLLFGLPATGGLVLLALTALRRTQRESEAVARLAERTRERDDMWKLIPDLLMTGTLDGRFVSLNPAWERVLGYRQEELLALPFWELINPDDVHLSAAAVEQMRRGETARHTNRVRTKSGDYRWFDWVSTPVGDVFYAVARDVTGEKDAAAELARAQDQLRQSQKMEAVGQLTGGIAHDFNNMLAIVVGSLDMLKRRLADGEVRHRRLVDNAMEGARRAAALTQRLLAFSRQQALQPEALDANKLVAGMSELLRRTLTESVRLETVQAGGLWRIFADPNQLESAVLNLAVNARDAMPEGGKLTIETANCHLDDEYAREHFGVPAGQYVMVAVTDTGTGMPPEVVARAFDPFFSTKEISKGTGLGLSMVYGFVKQSGGHVKIYSEPGQGTTVKLYLPRHLGTVDADAGPRQDATPALPRGTGRETVLIVEDEPAVRQLSNESLRELGYRVFEAEGAAEALRLLDRHPEITLLFTDVVMPEVNGAKLADEARRRRPDLKVLFTTGYTRNAVVHNGAVDPGVHLLGKPFTLEQLARKVAEVLDEPADRAPPVVGP